MPRKSLLLLLLAALALSACATVPPGTYFPDPRDLATQKVSGALHRAALAAGDDPSRYSFALVRSDEALVYGDSEATFYVTDGLARLALPVVEAELARHVAHEVLGHTAQRRAVSVVLTVGFTALGIAFPGAGLVDFLVNPLVVRAFSREQVKVADAKAAEILRAMGYPTPRRTLAVAIQAVDAANGRKRPKGWLLATQPPLAERLAALEPLEPPASPLAEAAGRTK